MMDNHQVYRDNVLHYSSLNYRKAVIFFDKKIEEYRRTNNVKLRSMYRQCYIKNGSVDGASSHKIMENYRCGWLNKFLNFILISLIVKSP